MMKLSLNLELKLSMLGSWPLYLTIGFQVELGWSEYWSTCCCCCCCCIWGSRPSSVKLIAGEGHCILVSSWKMQALSFRILPAGSTTAILGICTAVKLVP